VIPLDCIICGAVLVEDTKYSGDYFIIDTLDEDMFLRVPTVTNRYLDHPNSSSHSRDL
jgi:hypothetical protein